MNTEDKNTLLMKVVLVGESEVGKSSIFEMFCFGKEKSAHVVTIGIDFAYKAEATSLGYCRFAEVQTSC